METFTSTNAILSVCGHDGIYRKLSNNASLAMTDLSIAASESAGAFGRLTEASNKMKICFPMKMTMTNKSRRRLLKVITESNIKYYPRKGRYGPKIRRVKIS